MLDRRAQSRTVPARLQLFQFKVARHLIQHRSFHSTFLLGTSMWSLPKVNARQFDLAFAQQAPPKDKQ